jgi:hypothetical protein
LEDYVGKTDKQYEDRGGEIEGRNLIGYSFPLDGEG